MLDDSLADTQSFNFALALNAFDQRAAEIHDAPPLAPLAPFSPNPEQWRFLLLHARKNVTKWQWHFRDTILRAYADNGDTATISAGDLEEMLLAGVMTPGAGIADVRLTMRGMEMAQQ